MRVTRMATALAGLALLMGCSGGKKAQAKADARAAGFVPPSVLSRLDYGGIVERRFRALDRNNHEYITPDKLPAKDRDHDGRISAAEWSEGMLARFDRIDANHDGSVTSAERDALHGR